MDCLHHEKNRVFCRSLTVTNRRSIGEGKREGGDVDLDLDEGFDAPEPMLSVGDLTACDSGLL